MKKLTFVILLAAYSLIGFAQSASADITKTKDFKTGICTISLKPGELTPELTYTLSKIIDAKNNYQTTYLIKIKMANPFKKTLNKDLTCAIELDDDTYADKIQTKEFAGWFKETLTIELQHPEKMAHTGLKHILLKGEKTMLYHISESNREALKNNVSKIIQEQI
jgi:predicted ATP-dependent endonuclease of OLD family